MNLIKKVVEAFAGRDKTENEELKVKTEEAVSYFRRMNPHAVITWRDSKFGINCGCNPDVYMNTRIVTLQKEKEVERKIIGRYCPKCGKIDMFNYSNL